MKSRLLTQFREKGIAQLQKDLGLKNVMQVPQIEKVCINVGMGSYIQRTGKKSEELLQDALMKIAGQKPSVRKARLSVSNFKLREGMPVGSTVTLRKDRAYDFLDKLVNVVFPRVRDFRGVSRKIFDKKGNCSIGFKEHVVFPETELNDELNQPFGLQVTIVTTSDNSDHAMKMLEYFNFPFKK